MSERPRAAGLILAAGGSSRFGAAKLLAPLAGRPVLEHVLDATRGAGLDRVLVVLPPGADGDALQSLVAAAGAGSARNRNPERGLSSSVRLGLEVLAEDETIDAIVVMPGDQPLVRPGAIRAVLAALGDRRPIVVARHADGSPNPVALGRAAFGLAGELTADRGFGPILAAHPELVADVPIDAPNPDVDTRADLLAADWALRVRANREQVDRVREIPDGADFYAPVSGLFRDDPDRTGDEVLDAIEDHVRPTDVVLDVGAGAGRYALPLARRVRRVIAIDPSTAMLDALREDAAAHGIGNVETVAGRWPPRGRDDPLAAIGGDVSLVSQLGYDVEAIGPFLDALEEATDRRCLFVLNEQSPAAAASSFWPAVHDQARSELPALTELLAILDARGSSPAVSSITRPARPYASFEDARSAVERQLWVRPGGERYERFVRELERRAMERDGGWYLDDAPRRIGVVSWRPGDVEGKRDRPGTTAGR
ncbi:MAG TPA: NTP transferase domain-containing protein [Candidatus Limnocylindrales bacterium]|nr:NTP transferase domain-containing protein [Candidatus Limnocylindrales bacterium]